MRYRTRSLISTDTGREQNRTGQNKDQRFDQIIQRILLTKKKHLSQPRRIPLDQTVRNGDTGRLLAEIDRNRKRMRVRRKTSRRFIHLQIHDRNHRYKTPR